MRVINDRRKIERQLESLETMEPNRSFEQMLGEMDGHDVLYCVHVSDGPSTARLLVLHNRGDVEQAFRQYGFLAFYKKREKGKSPEKSRKLRPNIGRKRR